MQFLCILSDFSTSEGSAKKNTVVVGKYKQNNGGRHYHC